MSLGKSSKIRRLDERAMETSSGITDPNYTVFIGVLTVSDRCARGEKNDLSGPNLQQIIQQQTGFRSAIKVYKIIPDETDEIVATLVDWSDNLALELIVTTGGTGLGPRDVTPEATAAVIERETPGFTIAIITESLKITSDAMTTRLKSGIRGKTIIINLPGSKKASEECLKVILPAIPHALECMQDAVPRVCLCTVNDDYTNVASTRTLSSDIAAEVLRYKQAFQNPEQPVPADHHIIGSTAPVGANISEDELAEVDADVQSLLSNNVTSANAGTSSEGSTSQEKKSEDEKSAIGVGDAFEVVKNTTQVLDSEEVVLLDAFGRILAEEISVTQNNTPIANVSGYAITGSARNGEIRSLNAGGQARQISYGSVLPRGTDTVLSLKETRLLGGNKIQVLSEVKSGQGVRFVPTDGGRNLVIKKGTKLGPSETGQLTALGVTSCRVCENPTVGVLSVGKNEAEISNHITLQLYLRQYSIKPTDLGVISQDIGQLSEALSEAVKKVDIIIVTSKLEVCRRVAKSLIREIFDATIHFGAISIEPGAPCYFATVIRENCNKIFFVLPECPLASILCTLLVLPASRKMGGVEDIKNTTIKAKLSHNQQLKDKSSYLQCQVRWRPQEPIPRVENIGTDKTNQQLDLDANAILILPARSNRRPALKQGDTVDVIFIGNI